jgi:3-hydroxybutyryl-CoA dehydratase
MKFKIGDSASLSKTISEADVLAFADVTGDHNPIHLDEQFAKHSRFGRRIAHGMLGASLISSAIANELPGAGSIYLSQTLRFVSPVYLGDTITAHITITALREDKPIVTLETICENQNHEAVIKGEATVLIA